MRFHLIQGSLSCSERVSIHTVQSSACNIGLRTTLLTHGKALCAPGSMLGQLWISRNEGIRTKGGPLTQDLPCDRSEILLCSSEETCENRLFQFSQVAWNWRVLYILNIVLLGKEERGAKFYSFFSLIAYVHTSAKKLNEKKYCSLLSKALFLRILIGKPESLSTPAFSPLSFPGCFYAVTASFRLFRWFHGYRVNQGVASYKIAGSKSLVLLPHFLQYFRRKCNWIVHCQGVYNY